MPKEIQRTNNEINTFGEARKLILETISAIKNDTIPVNRAMAIAANMKVLNDNVQCEINAAKVTLLANERGHDFGKIVSMGKNVI